MSQLMLKKMIKVYTNPVTAVCLLSRGLKTFFIGYKFDSNLRFASVCFCANAIENTKKKLKKYVY